jgi:hypothetical protein
MTSIPHAQNLQPIPPVAKPFVLHRKCLSDQFVYDSINSVFPPLVYIKWHVVGGVFVDMVFWCFLNAFDMSGRGSCFWLFSRVGYVNCRSLPSASALRSVWLRWRFMDMLNNLFLLYDLDMTCWPHHCRTSRNGFREFRLFFRWRVVWLWLYHTCLGLPSSPITVL